MSNKWFIALAIAFVAQLFVPAQMIFERESIIDEGTAFKFKTAPIDPSDPFRGKYVYLNFELDEIHRPDSKKWADQTQAYVVLGEDENGFAKAIGLSASAEKNSVKARIIANNYDDQIRIILPFDHFYMDEFKAPAAEKAYTRATIVQALPESSSVCYAVVSVKDGEAVVTDVMIDGKSIREIASEMLQTKQ
ncbi:GDYXXLXY domain-containing protein [Flavobacterium sp.]|uniref:GDYXXLXY domain-containing protein n=1 Tax=Flavobacterium sp. TaxID=239 RepID=UPI00120ACFE0|nr:GDYXXLXY domain-containing protein [Flavobacterium sp.]RZJ70691.1 MAG: hypothetical protein EOO49_12620 [Flavobacterium sp.]